MKTTTTTSVRRAAHLDLIEDHRRVTLLVRVHALDEREPLARDARFEPAGLYDAEGATHAAAEQLERLPRSHLARKE